MPKDTSIKKILLIGSGPIVIGQGCEFDYSGVQACKALKEEGYEVVLVNSNPATIMTDPEFATTTYIEPIQLEIIEKIIEKERPDALLPTFGGQTSLNLALEAFEKGILEKYGIRLIGANAEAIRKGEDRSVFKKIMLDIGLDVPKSFIARSVEEALKITHQFGAYPLIIRPAFTLGGSGGGIAYSELELKNIVQHGLFLSPKSEVLIEESLVGWKEYEMEIIRDCADNCIVICSIENFDPMGVHTGDSITIAPIQTLTDTEYQSMRNAAFAIIRAIGVETGGSNIQFAVDPKTGRQCVIEMNPRVSRSSALASKATGYPIAKIAAKLAVGYELPELKNDITKFTTACFEPTLDYCVVKIPRFTFEKFPTANCTLTTQMKSVGEVMAIGATFKQALQKAIRSLEIGRFGLGADNNLDIPPITRDGEWDHVKIENSLKIPHASRIFSIRHALLAGWSTAEINRCTAIDNWFLDNISEIIEAEQIFTKNPKNIDFLTAKKLGFSDVQLAFITGKSEDDIRLEREKNSIKPNYKLVDTCAGEFAALTPYFYSTYGQYNEITNKNEKRKIMILGSGPNRIGQGIEFDYCCVHAAFAFRKKGIETIMVNSNPETVSTDYDISDKLYFEPLTLEDVLSIYQMEKCDGVVVQFGGQTPLNLSEKLQKHGVVIVGTQPESIELAEDRKHFSLLINQLGLKQTIGFTAMNQTEAVSIAKQIGYPIVVRPSFVLGGRSMEIIETENEMLCYLNEIMSTWPDRPLLIDQFLDHATEVDVDCICDGKIAVIGGIMEHIEEAGIHSGDSAAVFPTISLSDQILDTIRDATKKIALKLCVNGLMNIQYAIQNEQVYILEVNPRASRTIPFISKAIGVPLAQLAARIILGETLQEIGFTEEIIPKYFSIKEAVFPFIKFPGIDITLGPEMRSTGEVMALDRNFGIAYAKAQMAIGTPLPKSGNMFLSVKDSDKKNILPIAKAYHELGFNIYSTEGTRRFLKQFGIKTKLLHKISQDITPNVVDLLKKGEIDFVINTSSRKEPLSDEILIRTTAVCHRIPIMTTLHAAIASLEAIKSMNNHELNVQNLQSYHNTLLSS